MVRSCVAANVVALVLALGALFSVGCRSRSERDLVERELRMQEDQVYALEDYVAEYQEIVRRCRCENVELRRQLEELQSTTPSSSQKSTAPPVQTPGDDTWSPDRPRSRNLLDRRRAQPQPDPFRDDQPPVEPDATQPIPPVDAEAPEIELGPPMRVTPPAVPPPGVPAPITPPATPAPEQGSAVEPIYLEPDAPEIIPAGVLSDARPLSQTAPAPTGVQGEWVQLEDHEMPSLHVAVEPRTLDGAPTDYNGPLEVLLLDPSDGPTAPALARWEFTTEEVEQAWRDTQSREIFDVLAGLPDELPLDRPLELWVRLLPAEGGKVLASTVLMPREDASEALSEVRTQHEAIDDAVSPAANWVPSESTLVPKQASAGGGWSPRKP
ncbi:MAG: hypothetical protein WD851_10925 [Pirellulales bacterium]